MSTPTTSTPSASSKSSNPGPVYLREYSKAIYLYPLFFYSVFALIIQGVQETTNNDAGAPISWVSLLWMLILFANLFVIAFDFPTQKALLLFFIFVAIGLVIALLYAQGTIQVSDIDTSGLVTFNLEIKAKFYAFVSVILGLILFFVLIESLFKYVKVEPNEIYIRGIEGKSERFPTAGLHFTKEINDVFEFIALRSGKISLKPSGREVIVLENIPFVNKKEKQLDILLSVIKVSKN